MPNDDKNLIDVVIGGKVFKLSANENPDYIKKVAAYIDNKLRQLNVKASSNIFNDPNFALILALNIADELFKAKEDKGEEVDIEEPTPEQARQIAELKTQLQSKINDYDILLNQFQTKTNEVDSLKDTIYSHEDTISKLNIKAEGYKAEAENNRKTIESKSQYIIDLTKKINDKNQELNNLSKKLNEKNTSLNELNKKSAERNIKLNNVNKERDELAIKLKSANNNIRNLERDLSETLKLHEDELKTINSNNKKDIEKLNSEYKAVKESLENKISELEEKVKNLEHHNTALTEDSNALKKEYDNFRANLENATDGQLKAAFAKTKAENIELRRTVEELKTALSKIN
ncbi:MAG: cell division protein ZapA [Lachnospirales bacterium]